MAHLQTTLCLRARFRCTFNFKAGFAWRNALRNSRVRSSFPPDVPSGRSWSSAAPTRPQPFTSSAWRVRERRLGWRWGWRSWHRGGGRPGGQPKGWEKSADRSEDAQNERGRREECFKKSKGEAMVPKPIGERNTQRERS